MNQPSPPATERGASLRARIRAVLSEHAPGYEPLTVAVLDSDVDHLVTELDSNLVIRLPLRAGVIPEVGLKPTVEAALLRALGGVLDIPLPVPVFQDDASGLLGYRKPSGVPLLHHPLPESNLLVRLGRRLGGILADLHGADASDLRVDLPIDPGPASYLRSAAAAWVSVTADRHCSDRLPRAAIVDFVASPAPAHPPHPALCHLDLGTRNILLDVRADGPPAGELSGILNWTGAAIGDPARDFGLLLRDLGESALDSALDGYRRAGAVTDDDPDLLSRIVFHARCGLLEDLSSGLRTGRTGDLKRSLARLALFG